VSARPKGSVLSVSQELVFNRLIWLCEGLAQMHPSSKEHRHLLSVARGARRLAMAGEVVLVITALALINEQAQEALSDDESLAIKRRVEDSTRALRR
jgi:hypothetical protein